MNIEEFNRLKRAPTAAELADLVRSMGWEVTVSPDGRPVFRTKGQHKRMAVALKKILKGEPYRSKFLTEARRRWEMPPPEPQQIVAREWLWRFGHTHTETPDDAWLWGNHDRHPAGAWWWRFVGSDRWSPIQGRCNHPPEGDAA